MIQPYAEYKLTRVIRGYLFEVVLDLRKDSPTYKKYFGIRLAATDNKLMLIPPGCAHAVLTLEDDTEYLSHYSVPYDSKKESGIRFDDPAFQIKWPIPINIVSEKDRSWSNFTD